MLHILLLILKFIGIIIAAILGILVLLVCIVLFVPIKYEVQGKCGGRIDSLKGKARVTWLLRLFRADLYYKDGDFKWRLGFAIFKRASGSQPDTEKDTKKDTIRKKKADTKKEKGDQDEKEQKISDEKLEESKEKLEEAAAEALMEEEPEEMEETEGIESDPKESEEVGQGCEEADEETDEETSAVDQEPEQDEDDTERKGNHILQKVKAVCEKIKCTFEKFCDRIRLLKEKKGRLAGFVHDETHRRAFSKVKKELFWFLGKLKPGKVEIKVRYGFEDPYYTGKVLAGLSILYPFLGDSTEIIPDFEHKVLDGGVCVKGRIRLSHAACLAWKLFWNKDVRQSYRDIKNFRL